MKKIIIILGIIIVVLLGALVLIPAKQSVAPILPQSAPNPQTAHAPAPNPAEADIRVFSPKQNDEISSPVSVSGEVKRAWFFEAVFPVRVLDGDGIELGRSQARAQGDWMTTDFVPFKAMIEFRAPKFATGTILLMNDNPSGLPERAKEFKIPVRFGKTGAAQAPCRPTGCSKEICSDEEEITPCVYLPEFACYKTARCERQASGECGWTQTAELQVCLQNAAKSSPAVQ